MYKLLNAAITATTIFSSTYGINFAPSDVPDVPPPAYSHTGHIAVIHPITPTYLSLEETTAKLEHLKQMMESKNFQVCDAIECLLELPQSNPQYFEYVKFSIKALFPEDQDYTQLNCHGESQAQQLVRFAYLVLEPAPIANCVLNNIIWAFDNYSAWEKVRRRSFLSITPFQRVKLWEVILRHYPRASNTNLRNLKEFALRLLEEFYQATREDDEEEQNAQNQPPVLDGAEHPDTTSTVSTPCTPLAPQHFGPNFEERINQLIAQIDMMMQPNINTEYR